MPKSEETWGYGAALACCMAAVLFIMAVAIETPFAQKYFGPWYATMSPYAMMSPMYSPLPSPTPLQKIASQSLEILNEFNKRLYFEVWLYTYVPMQDYIVVNALLISPFLVFGWVFFRLEQEAKLRFRGIAPGKKRSPTEV